jgi:predicted transcriptional regulator
MNKKERLSLVFDFISDYLINEGNVNDTEVEVDKARTSFEGTMGRAHDIMKKMDDIDKADAKVKSAVNNATKPLKEAIKDLSEKFTKKTGVTLDNEGKVVEVNAGPLKEYTTISEVMNKINN